MRGLRKSKLLRIEEVGSFRKANFDTVLLYGIGLNLLQNIKKAKTILKALGKITSKNGLIIAESRDPYITNNPVHFAYHKRNLKKGRLPGQLREKVRFMQYSSSWFDVLFLSKNEVKKLISGTGWFVKRFIDSRDYREDGKFMVIMEKK